MAGTCAAHQQSGTSRAHAVFYRRGMFYAVTTHLIVCLGLVCRGDGRGATQRSHSKGLRVDARLEELERHGRVLRELQRKAGPYCGGPCSACKRTVGLNQARLARLLCSEQAAAQSWCLLQWPM
jgi:3-methyladenine DNA glycosylase Mpg